MNKQRKTKSKVRQRSMRQSPEIEVDHDISNKNSKRQTTGNQFHPANNGFTDTDQMSDMESAEYIAGRRGPTITDNESDVPPRFIENETLHRENNFKSAMEHGTNISPNQQNEGKFKLGGLMESDIEESGNMQQKMGLDQSFSTEKSLKDNLDQTGAKRQRPKTAYNKPKSYQHHISPTNRANLARIGRRNSPKPGFLMQNEGSQQSFNINQRIRNKKKETQNKILEKAYNGSGASINFNQYTNRSRKLVPTKQHKSQVSVSNKKNTRPTYDRNSDVYSQNMKATMNDNLSDNTFDLPQTTNKRSRVQSAYVKQDQIDEIQEEAFDSINIKTSGASFIQNEQEQSGQLINYYRQKFANKEKSSKSVKAMSFKERNDSIKSVKSSQSFMIGFGKEDLADKLYECKVKLNKVSEDKKTLATQNKGLKREIQANEKVIQMMLKNEAPSATTQNNNHYSLMIQHKRKLREALQDNNGLKICIDQMRKDMRHTKEAELKKENQELLIQSQTMQFNIKRLQDYIIDLKEKLSVHVKTDLARSDNIEQYELKSQIQDYKKIAKKQEQTIDNFEKNNLVLQEEIQGYRVKIESIKHKFETRESKLQFKISQQESDMSNLSHLKRQIDAQKTELKSNRIVFESFKPKMDQMVKDKVQLTKERDYLNTELTNGVKAFKQQLKEKNREINTLNEDIESKLKALSSKHTKELNQINSRLNKSLGQNKNLDEMLVQKQTDFSSETKYKVQIKKLEMEVDSLKESLKLTKKRGVTPKKKKKMTSMDYDKDELYSSNLDQEQKILEKQYAIEKLMSKVGSLESKNKELLQQLNGSIGSTKNLIIERNESEEKSDNKNQEGMMLQQSNEALEKLNIEMENNKEQLTGKDKMIEEHKQFFEQVQKQLKDANQQIALSNNNFEEVHNDLDQKNKVIQELSQQINDLNNQVELKTQELEPLQAAFDNLQEQHGSINKEFEALKQKYDSGEIDRDNLEMDIQNHLNNIKEKEQQLDEAHGSLMDLQNNHSKDKDELGTVHADQSKVIEEQQQEIEKIKESLKQVSELEYHVETLETEILELKEQNNAKVQEHGGKVDELQNLEQTINEVKSELTRQEQLVEEKDFTIKEMLASEEKLKLQIQTNKVKITELNQSVEEKGQMAVAGTDEEIQAIHEQRLQEKDDHIERLHKDYKCQLGDKHREMEELNEIAAKIQEEIQQLKVQKEDEEKNYTDQIEQHKQQLETLQKLNDAKDTEIMEHEKQYNMLQESREQRKSISHDQDQIDNGNNGEIKQQYLEVKNHLEQAIFEKDQLQAQVESLTRDNGQASSEKLAYLETENQELREKIEQMDVQGNDYGDSSKNVKRESSGMTFHSQETIDNSHALQEAYNRQKEEAIEAKDKYYELEINVNTMTADIKELNRSLKEKENDVERIKEDLTHSQNDLKEAKNDILEFKSEIKNKNVECKKLQNDLEKVMEAKNLLFDKLMAEKDSKTALIQQFASEKDSAGMSLAITGSPKASKKSSQKMNKKSEDIDITMEKVDEEVSQEIVSDEEEDFEEEEELPKVTQTEQSDLDDYAAYVESSDGKSIISIDAAEDENPSDNDDYEKLYLKANKRIDREDDMGTIDEFSQSQRTVKSGMESALGFLVEDNPPDPLQNDTQKN